MGTIVLTYKEVSVAEKHPLKPIDMSGLGSMAGGAGVDPELKEFLEQEQAKAQIQQQVQKLTDVCWDTCIDKPKDRLDSRSEACIANCVERFIDTTVTITGRFQKLLQQQMGQQ